jgi:hypothetical protein
VRFLLQETIGFFKYNYFKFESSTTYKDIDNLDDLINSQY